jgi:hypothetical protein
MPCVNSGEKETQTRAWKAGGTFVEFPPIVGRFSVGLKPTKTFGNHSCKLREVGVGGGGVQNEGRVCI